MGTKFEAKHAEKIVETFIKIFAAREGLEVKSINVKAIKCNISRLTICGIPLEASLLKKDCKNAQIRIHLI